MTAIQEKYNRYRPLSKTGDIITFRGNGTLARIEQYFTDGYVNHVEVIWRPTDFEDRVMVIGSNAPGVHPEWAHVRIDEYDDFVVIRPNRTPEEIHEAINWLMGQSQEGTGIKYNFLRLLRIAVKDSFGVDLKWLDQKGHDICSQFVQLYCEQINMQCYSPERVPLITPQDYLDRLYSNEGEILFRN